MEKTITIASDTSLEPSKLHSATGNTNPEDVLFKYAFEEHPKHTLTPNTVQTPHERPGYKILTEKVHELRNEIMEIEGEQIKLKNHLTQVEQSTEKLSNQTSLTITHLLLKLNENNLATARDSLAFTEEALNQPYLLEE